MRRRLRNTFVVQDERSETVHNPKAKLKTLYAMHIMQGETDAERGLLLREIIERLGDRGIQAECKDPRNDIQALRAFSCTDALHKAMCKKMKVEFMCCKYNVDGNRYAIHDGKPHLVTPVRITFDDGYYCLTAWNDNHEAMTEFRIDRMEKLKVSDERATRNERITHREFEGEEHELFGRFGGEPVTATLLVDGGKAEIIVDRFGDVAEWYAQKDGTAKLVVKICKSEQFFGWVAGLGGTVRIRGPKSLKKEYEDYLTKLIEGNRK